MPLESVFCEHKGGSDGSDHTSWERQVLPGKLCSRDLQCCHLFGQSAF